VGLLRRCCDQDATLPAAYQHAACFENGSAVVILDPALQLRTQTEAAAQALPHLLGWCRRSCREQLLVEDTLARVTPSVKVRPWSRPDPVGPISGAAQSPLPTRAAERLARDRGAHA
jgi:hypothetical protein